MCTLLSVDTSIFTNVYKLVCLTLLNVLLAAQPLNKSVESFMPLTSPETQHANLSGCFFASLDANGTF